MGRVSRLKGGVQYSAAYVLDAVLLADDLRPLTTETDLLPQVVDQCLSLALQPELAQHIRAQQVQLPKRLTLYEFRLSIDWACMLWAREWLLTASMDWHCHLRLDSSPQFSRNYLVGELDWVSAGAALPSMDLAQLPLII